MPSEDRPRIAVVNRYTSEATYLDFCHASDLHAYAGGLIRLQRHDDGTLLVTISDLTDQVKVLINPRYLVRT